MFGIFALVIFSSVKEIKGIYPFYFNYTNELLPKNDIITTAWGYGGYEAAKFINNLSDDPKSTIVWTDYGGVCSFF